LPLPSLEAGAGQGFETLPGHHYHGAFRNQTSGLPAICIYSSMRYPAIKEPLHVIFTSSQYNAFHLNITYHYCFVV
jgi:hypothetical protein